MEVQPDPTPSPSGRRNSTLAHLSWRRRAAWLVLIVGLLGTWRAWEWARVQSHSRGAEIFRSRVERIQADIEHRMRAYDQVLRGAAGLFAASDLVERDEWHTYVDGLRVEDNYRGIHCLGFVEYLTPSRRGSFVADLRHHHPDFDIHPTGARPEYFVVKYVQPFETNRVALGYDIGVESTRRLAAENARDAGDSVLTGRLRLVQSSTNTPGVLLLRPIYRGGTDPGETNQRRAAIYGWVYGAFQLDELMETVLRDDAQDVDFEIHDEEQAAGEQTLLYRRYPIEAATLPAAPAFATNSTLDFAHHSWGLQFRSRPLFGAADRWWNSPAFIAIIAGCMTVLLFGITHALASTQARAQALARDITRTLQVQEQAMSSSSQSIIILDATQPGLSIIYANPAVERMTGYTAEELIGRDGSILLGHEREQAGVAELGEAIRQGRECRTVLRCYRKDKTSFWNEINLSPVKSRSGVTTHFISVSTDITARREAERHLEEARAAAESASRAKSEFLANMSHEIRTPLNAVLGLTDLVLETPLNDEQRQLLSSAQQSANELADLVNEVLDFSRIEAGKVELHPEAFVLRSFLEECLAAFSARAREKGLRLTLRLGDGLPDAVVADGLRLRQVLLNLLSNAIKFTAEGTVTLEVRKASRPPAADLATELEFIVSDTGIGIAPAKQQSIFEAFTQADNSITRRYGGTGLGLAISKRLVDLLGGRIWVESSEGRGSAFHFTAQMGRGTLTPVTRDLGKGAKPAATALRPLQILVVEDNPINAQLATTLLERLGHKVTAAGNGNEAIALVARGGLDLVLMDLQMPGLDGLQATARIREQERERGAHVPIIAVTAHALPEDRAQCLARGMDDYLAKPVRRADLFAAMERLFPGSTGPAAAGELDAASLRTRLDQELNGDVAAMGRMIHLYLETTPGLVKELRDAAAARDAARLSRAAHALKGSVMQMGGEQARGAALAVEEAADKGDVNAAVRGLARLEQEVEQLSAGLRQLL